MISSITTKTSAIPNEYSVDANLPSVGSQVEKLQGRLENALTENDWWRSATQATGSAPTDLAPGYRYENGEQGILLVGGTGARLRPLTENLNKHLLPVGEQPVFFYPLANLIRSGVTSLAVSSSERDIAVFQKILKFGAEFGISIHYHQQEGARGVATALADCFSTLNNKPTMLALGDTIFTGAQFPQYLNSFRFQAGAELPLFRVTQPKLFETVEFSKSGKAVDLHEKAKHAPSSLVAGGLYVFDPRAKTFAEQASESPRGEFDVNSVNKAFLHRGELTLRQIPEGAHYIDTGRFETLAEAHDLVTALPMRERFALYSPHVAALQSELISRSKLLEICDQKAAHSKYFSDLKSFLINN